MAFKVKLHRIIRRKGKNGKNEDVAPGDVIYIYDWPSNFAALGYYFSIC